MRYKKKWGAIGISRIASLMGKPLIFNSLVDLIEEFRDCYKECWHEIEIVSVGLPFSHDEISESPLQWKVLKLVVDENTWEEIYEILLKYTSDCLVMLDYYRNHGKLPDIVATGNYRKGNMKKHFGCVTTRNNI